MAKLHFLNRSANAKPTNHLSTERAWCGREVKRLHVTERLTAVECIRCREAFADELRRLPDVLGVAPR